MISIGYASERVCSSAYHGRISFPLLRLVELITHHSSLAEAPKRSLTQTNRVVTDSLHSIFWLVALRRVLHAFKRKYRSGAEEQ